MKQTCPPIFVPDWDRTRPLDSFKKYAEQIRRQAGELMVSDGSHAEMFFFLNISGNGHIMLWQSNDRDREAKWLRKHIAAHYIYAVIHVVEAWLRLARGVDDPLFRRVMSGETRVSELPTAERQEALIVSAQSRDGWSMSWSTEIVRDADGNPTLGDCLETGDFRGRFGRLFG